MNFKGQAILEFVDVNTGEKRVEKRDNFIFVDKYNDLFQGSTRLFRVALFRRGSDVYPQLNRHSAFYGEFSGQSFYTGYAPTGTFLKTYFPKTTSSPAYWEFYSLFLPPATTSPISCLCLISSDHAPDNNYPLPVGYGEYNLSRMGMTAINLNPPCYQSPTEFLNVYYRLILIEDEEDTFNNEWVKEQFILDVDRGQKRFFNNDQIMFYPFRIEEDTSSTGNVRFLTWANSSLASKQTVHPTAYNLSLSNARKIYNYPDSAPNQYDQINDVFTNTLIRGGKTCINYQWSYIHPVKFSPNLGERNFNGIGNVFGTAEGSDSSYFDAAFFPLGSGRMYAGGQWMADAVTYPANYDEFFTDVSLLIHANDEATLEDSSSSFNNVVNQGVSISTTRAKFGGASAYFNGSNALLSIDQNANPVGNEKFCIEFFMFLENYPVDRYCLFNFRNSSPSGLTLEVRSNGDLGLLSNTDDVYQRGGAAAMTLNQWHHVAVTRTGNDFTVWIDGVSTFTITSAATFTKSLFYIGHNQDRQDDDFVGYIDELRITKGFERYSSAFTPPVAEFYDYSDHSVIIEASSSAKKTFPEMYEIKVTQSGEFATNMKYNFKEFHRSPEAVIPILPSIYHDTSSGFNLDGVPNVPYYWDAAGKGDLYENPNSVHCGFNIRKWIEERAFITWDATGITICDIYHGTLNSFDSSTTPALTVADVRDVKVDSNGNIWIACASTGLWKLQILENTTTLTQIGEPPGCQSKVYALDVDNFGTVYAIFWGLGLHYTIDGGGSWINAIINFSSFSDFDESGMNSKWRFCSRLVANPHKNAGNGDAQLLLLQRTDVNDGSITAGCWYDQISATTTIITNSTMRSDLTQVRNNPTQENIVVSRQHNKWIFNTGVNLNAQAHPITQVPFDYTAFDGTTRKAWNMGAMLEWVSFQQNSEPVPFRWRTPDSTLSKTHLYHGHFACVFYEEKYDHYFGQVREFVYTPKVLSCPSNHASAWDVEFHELRTYDGAGVFVTAGSYGTNNSSSISKAVMIGKNKIASIAYHKPDSADLPINQHRANFSVSFMFSPNVKQHETWASTQYGWDGSQWVPNHIGSRDGHYNIEDLKNGVNIRFENGPASTTSFNATDKFRFTCFDGYYKDNSSKMWIKDTIYYKPKTEETTFTPGVVSLYDKSGDIGVLNSPDINVDWNIDKLPDTTYDGQALVLDGDSYYPFVEYLNYFSDNGDFGSKDEKYNQPPTSITGSLTASPDLTIFGDNLTTYFDGESGVFYASNSRYSLGSGNFTIELWVWPQVYTLTNQLLLDFRGSGSEIGSLNIDKLGRVFWFNGSTSFGLSGCEVIPEQWNYISLSRDTSNLWALAINGTVRATWTDATAFAATRPLHIGKRFEKQTDWSVENGSFLETKVLNPSGVQIAETFSANTTNTSIHTTLRYFTLDQETYTSSIFAKKGTRRYFMLRTGINNLDTRTIYDFDTDSFVSTGAGHIAGSEILTDGWVRLWVTMTENSNNVSRYFSWGPHDSATSTTSWTGTTGEESVYIWGAMLNFGNVLPYVASGSAENLWETDSENFAGNWRGFRGNMSNLRITKGVARYGTNNMAVPSERFQNANLSYGGARMKFPGTYLQGSIVSKKELVGDWVVAFRDIPENFKFRDQTRPRLAFGITTTPVVNNVTDLAYRFLAGKNDTLLFQRWVEAWSDGQLGSSVNAIRFRKVGQNIFIDTSTTNGIFWTQQFTYADFAGVHYIAMWQERPSSNNIIDPLISPSVEIISNGFDYVSKVGSPDFASGSFHPRFLAVDSYWESDFKIQLNGIPTTKNRSNYQAEALPLEGEVYMHQHGTLRFHPADVGKTITGTVMSLHE